MADYRTNVIAEPTEPITTENVVDSTVVDKELTLDALAMDRAGAEYDPDRFPELIYPVDEPRATAPNFQSEEVVVLGGEMRNRRPRACESIVAPIHWNRHRIRKCLPSHRERARSAIGDG